MAANAYEVATEIQRTRNDEVAFVSPGTNGPINPPAWLGSEAAAITLGNQGNVARHFPQTIISQGGEPMIVLGKRGSNLWLSAKFFSHDGRIMTEVISNKLVRNPRNTFRMDASDHRVTVIGDDAKPVIDVEFLSPWHINVTGKFHLRGGLPVEFSNDGILIAGQQFLKDIILVGNTTSTAALVALPASPSPTSGP
jgi:hypothetical protein